MSVTWPPVLLVQQPHYTADGASLVLRRCTGRGLQSLTFHSSIISVQFSLQVSGPGQAVGTVSSRTSETADLQFCNDRGMEGEEHLCAIHTNKTVTSTYSVLWTQHVLVTAL